MEKQKKGEMTARKLMKRLKFARFPIDGECKICLNLVYDDLDRLNFKNFLDDGYELQK